jgi:hypothetical protein
MWKTDHAKLEGEEAIMVITLRFGANPNVARRHLLETIFPTFPGKVMGRVFTFVPSVCDILCQYDNFK